MSFPTFFHSTICIHVSRFQIFVLIKYAVFERGPLIAPDHLNAWRVMVFTALNFSHGVAIATNGISGTSAAYIGPEMKLYYRYIKTEAMDMAK